MNDVFEVTSMPRRFARWLEEDDLPDDQGRAWAPARRYTSIKAEYARPGFLDIWPQAGLVTLVLIAPAMARAADAPASVPATVINESSAIACSVNSGTTNCTASASDEQVFPAAVTVSNGQDPAAQQTYPLVATIEGSATASGLSSFYYFGAFGQQPNDTYPSLDYVQGSPVTVTTNADLQLQQASGSEPAFGVGFTNDDLTAYYVGEGGGAVSAYSRGGAGFPDNVKNPDVGNFNGAQGGPVAVTNAGNLTVEGGGGGYGWLAGIGPCSVGGDGAANKTGDTDYAGDGGAGGAVTVSNTGSIAMSNSSAMETIGIFGFSQGGGPGALLTGDHPNLYGSSGAGGAVTIENSGTITSSAPNGIGIYALSLGGDGGLETGHGVGSQPGTSGSGGAVAVTLTQGSSISIDGGGIGVLAASSVGPSAYSTVDTSISGGAVAVTVEEGASVSVTGGGAFAMRVAAISTGSPDVLRPFDTTTVSAMGSGYSGAVTVENAGTITTSGELAIGIGALSFGGAGILTSASAGGVNDFGNYAPSSLSKAASGVTVTNAGTIVTNGASAFGILAASDGAGGVLNATSDAAYDNGTLTSGTIVGGLDGSGANGGAVDLTHSGEIITGDGAGGGDLAIGILAQSVGGAGGTSGGTGVAAFVGDAGGTGGSGATVTVTTQPGSQITTQDQGALGILAQSIGGGGGNGGNAAGLFVATGGQGGTGGEGGAVNVDLANQGLGGITTTGHFSAGVVAQSIGGGGGNGGYGAAAGTFLSFSIGGAGGDGGAGGGVDLINDATLRTSGNQSFGMIAQSIGGGGGTGGAAYSYSVGVLTAAVAVGGRGGGGGAGGAVSVTNDYHIYTGCDAAASGCGFAAVTGPSTDGADAIGLLAQSIGGGGGTGGGATAKALALPGGDTVPLEFSLTYATGGSGGDGGDGETVAVANAGEVVTAGDGAYGILAQSVGGGGGTGADSTAATYAIEGEAPSVKLALALGGRGGVAGDGAAVTIVNGESSSCGGCDAQVYTYGQGATGILAQSIGGGGGAGGAGNASASSPNLGGTTGTSVDVTLSVGGDGGGGGHGGAVTVTNDAGSAVVTTGAGSQGVLAQSIGGGGGAAGGGQAAASGDSYQGNISVGGNGGSGDDGGYVTVTNAGLIATGARVTNAAGLTIATGGDAVGIFAQSIGGGGGVAGTSDAAATIDAEGQVEDALNAPSTSYSANLSVGGVGGAAGDGGTVAVTNSGTLTTIGIRAHGIEAQSIGGGGGSAGAATSASNSVLGGPNETDEGENSGTYAADISVGGFGGAAGEGGAVTLTNSGAVTAQGYGAHALFAQSVGGGGGAGAEGSVDNTTTIGLGAGFEGDGGASGNGGTITLDDSGALIAAGDDAYGILAQSIGAGGGLASAGCSNSASVAGLDTTASLCLGNSAKDRTVSTSVWNDSSDYTVTLAGVNGASGNGGAVTIDKTAGSILTSGARGFGIIAQSIGGGGGLFAAADVNVAGIGTGGGTSAGAGGEVSISLGDGVGVTTYGDGAYGVLAQSIGGGGGFAGDASLTLSVGAANAANNPGITLANSGAVNVTTGADIVTHGANAHGLFLQSLAGGDSGAFGDDGQVRAGNGASSQNGVTGTAGEITVTQTGGQISATGAGSIGIFAQSSGDSGAQNPIGITLGGDVLGGSGADAAGIRLSGGMSSNVEYEGPVATANTITITAGGSVGTTDGVLGSAIVATDSVTEVVNAGTLTGGVDLGNSAAGVSTVSGAISNSGLFESGASVVAASLTNTGTLAPSGEGAVGTTSLSGDFTQSASGVLAVDIDALGTSQTADLLAVAGTAALAGKVQPLAASLLPGSYEVLTAQTLTGAVTALDSLLFAWTVDATDASVSLVPVPTLASSDLPLSANAAAVASYLQRAWDAGGSTGLAPLFGKLSQLEQAPDYQSLLSDLSGESRPAHASDQLLASRQALDSSFSCPVFIGESTMMTQARCSWAQVSAGEADRDGATDYRRTARTLRFGGQTALEEGWYLGATAAYGTESTESWNGGGHSDGHTVDAGLALKRVTGPRYVGAGVNIGYNWYDETRAATIAGVPYALGSESSILTISGRVRAAYEFAYSAAYLKPYADIDLFYSHQPGYTESGPEGIALDVSSESKLTAGFSPMLEAGGRVVLDADWVLRPYAAGGLLLLSNGGYATEARLVGAPEEAGSFTVESDLPRMLGRLNLGLQLYHAGNFDLRVEYDVQSGSDYLAQSQELRLSYRF
jgi:hypothetical protein